MSLTEALLAWASSCFGAPLSRPSDCSDGVGVARILHGLDAHHFSQKWLATIKVRQWYMPGAFVFLEQHVGSAAENSPRLKTLILRMFWQCL